ncbi:gephyrin-like molybdotransferase Glp [Novispirillum sp. DQ9]|uniref:molybdopterin molybdotransferase MoeA n=1 Tax=Novispirillum sp. DQ9 TaxID=3398612 RepID=UPI003C7E595C
MLDLNDCFKAPDSLIRLDEVLGLLDARLTPVVGTETVPLAEAAGRVLAEDVVADNTVPPFPSAAMDGFAFRAADLAGSGETALRITARIAAGHPHKGAFGPGEAARIFTGAPVPADLDTVVMEEDVRVDGATVFLPEGLTRGTFVRPAGEDFFTGATVLTAGRRLRPQDVAMAGAAGRGELTVFRRLRVAVFATGDELVEPGRRLPEGAVYCSNRFGLVAAARALGCEVEDLGTLPDRVGDVRDALDAASRSHDLLITSGGVSIGGEDHVRAVVESLGAVHLWRMAIKPGKPTALGSVGPAAFVGLPGYPVSSMVIFMIVARPVILRLSGATAEPLLPPRLKVRAGFSFTKKHKRRQFLRAALRVAEDGQPEVVGWPSQEPSVLSSLVGTDGLIDFAEDATAIAPGDMVDFLLYQQVQA